MKVRFYSFSKRNKSTKQVGSTSYNELELKLKDGCNIENPIFLLQTVNPTQYNYMYVLAWNRYYFINNVDYYEGMWEVSGTEDYLGSFKSAIGSTSCLILYASGASNDLPDSRIPVKATLTRGYNSVAFPWGISNANGAVILGITGKGSFGPYILKTRADLHELLDGVDNFVVNWDETGVAGVVQAAKQLFFGGSAAQCLKSAIEIPIIFTGSNHGVDEILVLGSYPCADALNNPIHGYRITNPYLDGSATVTIPWNETDWRCVSAYSDICLYIPFIGTIALPASELHINDTSLTVHIVVNITSGDIAVEVKGGTSYRIYCTASGNCAMPTAYGSTGIDTNRMTAAITSGIGTVIGAGVAIASGGFGALASVGIGAGLASVASNTLAALGGNASGSGGLGGGAISQLDPSIKCWVITKQLSDSQANLDSLIGKPYSKKATPSSFTGFIQTDGFQFESTAAFSHEKDMINSLMDSGIYYE